MTSAHQLCSSLHTTQSTSEATPASDQAWSKVSVALGQSWLSLFSLPSHSPKYPNSWQDSCHPHQ